MNNYESWVTKKGLHRDNITNFYSNNIGNIESMSEMEFGSNNIHNIGDSYDQKKKLKEIITNNLK